MKCRSIIKMLTIAKKKKKKKKNNKKNTKKLMTLTGKTIYYTKHAADRL